MFQQKVYGLKPLFEPNGTGMPINKEVHGHQHGLVCQNQKEIWKTDKNNMQKDKSDRLIPIGRQADLQGLSPTRFKTQLSVED